MGDEREIPRVRHRESEISGGGLRFRFRESGAGDVVVWLGDISDFSALRALVAAHFRVVELQLPGEAMAAMPNLAQAIKEAVATLGGDRFSLVARGEGVAFAISLALDHPQCVEALALLSPTVIATDGRFASDADEDLVTRLGASNMPVLTVFGTKDSLAPPEAGRHYRTRIAACNVVFVYDAGHQMEEERPEAVAELVIDFFQRRDHFLVRRVSDLLYP